MDTIKLRCRCGQHIEVDRNAAGQRFRCPACDRLLAVPYVSVEANTIAEAEPDLQSTQVAFKKTIVLSILLFVGGVAVAVAGVAIKKKPVLTTGMVVALFAFGGLYRVKLQMRRIQKQNEERKEFYRKFAKRS